MSKQRCGWCLGDPLYERYHDEEWGVPLYDDAALLEFLILEGAQGGLSWITILKKRENYRNAFDNFDAQIIAQYDESRVENLMKNPGIVRNRLKILSTVNNAQRYLELMDSEIGFSEYLWSFVDGHPKENHWRRLSDLPAQTTESEAMSKDLKAKGFKFVGPTICYAFMQATGMVNDHEVSCFRHADCQSLAT
ncbi:MAG TPA: DNA-3-methyladenine glycosylase I [Gammaproteobacteria bacterium]|nr:DNA-3-methyladenine glycosylase I [Gammaproteobacteria bacterium]